MSLSFFFFFSIFARWGLTAITVYDDLNVSGADQSLNVNSLFDATTHQWDKGPFKSLFYNSTRDDILGIKLGNAASRDKLYWKENKQKLFSVKIAYQLALRLHSPSLGEHSLAHQDRSLWKKLWLLHTTPKVLNFPWRY